MDDVLGREKFAGRLSRAGLGFSALASVVEPAEFDPVISADPDDDAALARALGARASRIVSGDRHLLDLRRYCGILILSAAEFRAEIAA